MENREIINEINNIGNFININVIKRNKKSKSEKSLENKIFLKTILENQIKNSIQYLLIYLLVLINLVLFVASKMIYQYNNKRLCFSNEIKIKILGKGNQQILHTYFKSTPTKIYVNEEESSINDQNQITNLEQEENIIIISWDYKLTEGDEMFSDISTLTEVDFSDFDASELTSISCMFYGCYSLISINFTNFNAPLLKDISHLFFDCISLSSIDLSSFSTSLNIKNMGSMFHNCSSLKYVNFGNLNTYNVISFAYLFSDCPSLESIDLSKFDTSSITSMDNMFSGCVSLTSLDLSNFITTSLKSLLSTFEGCSNLKYLDISNFDTSKVTWIYSYFKGCENLEYIKFGNFIEGNYKESSSGMFEGVPDNLTYCLTNPDNVFIILEELNNKNCSINDCSNYWNIKTKKIIEEKKMCVYDCSDDETYINQYKNKCYDNCPEGTILSNNENKCLVVCSESSPFEKEEDCYTDCSTEEFFSEICILNNKNTKAKEKMVNTIESEIINESINELLEDILNNNGNDLIKKDINEIYQITTSNNQISKEYTNGESTIDLGECKNLLKEQNSISDDESLIIYKMDYYLDALLIPIIEYEIFNPSTKSKLNLDICSETKISINIPVEIDEKILYKYNPLSEYYKDKCYPSSSECGDDNTLTKRINEFNEGYLSLCENNCEFKEYDANTKKVKCECQIKTNFDKLSEILNKKADLLYQITISEKDTVLESVIDIDKDSESIIYTDSYKDKDSELVRDIDTIKNTDSVNETDNKNFDKNIECLFKSKKNGSCENSINLQDLIENKYISLNEKNSIDKVFDLFSKELKYIDLKNDEIIEGEGVTYQMTTTENQEYYLKNNLNNDISCIYLGECENILKEKYKINEPLIIIKLDIKRNDTISTQVEYQVFNPINLEKLNLSYCENIKIDIYPPINIDNQTYNLIRHLKEQGYDLFNSFDDFYNDICSPYNSFNNTDVILNDRRNDYYIPNITLCEENCEYESFDIESIRAKCKCNVKKEVISDTKKIKFSPNIIIENFYKLEKYANIKVVICYLKVFDIERLKKNLGSYLIIIIGFLFIIFMIINSLTINTKIRKIIKLLLDQSHSMIKELKKKEKEKEDNNKKNKEKHEKKRGKKSNKNRQNSKTKNKPRKEKLSLNKIVKTNNKKYTSNPTKKNNNKKNIFNSNKDKISRNKFEKKEYLKKKEKFNSVSNKSLLNSMNEKFLSKPNKIKIKPKIIRNEINIINSNSELKIKLEEKEDVKLQDKIINLIPKKERMKYFNDDQLNSLEYKDALLIDFRSYGEFYFSLLKETHLIIFTFFVNNDYNLFLLKLSLFLISFSLFFFMNALFFSDDSLHKIYEDQGKYDFIYQIPQIMYSTITSQVISSLLEKLSLSQDIIQDMKEKGDITEIKKDIAKVIKCIKVKCFLFFIIGIILHIGFWYYLSAFCSVYYNSQIPLIKDTFTSFINSLIYPFALVSFPGIFRILGLRYKKKCLYITSNIVTKIIGIL